MLFSWMKILKTNFSITKASFKICTENVSHKFLAQFLCSPHYYLNFTVGVSYQWLLMDHSQYAVFLSIILTFFPLDIEGKKHISYAGSCGGDDTCDRNKGLYCDIDRKICLCSEAAVWMLEFDEEYYCRVLEGKKCGRSLTSPRCERGLHCETERKGDLVQTVCKCPAGKYCGSLDSRSGTGNNTGVSIHGPSSVSMILLLTLLPFHFFYNFV